MRPIPCKTCPWRTDQTAATIPGYSHSKACGLMNTVGDTDAMRPIMACHGSIEGKERVCNGYLAMEGERNINVRILASMGKMAYPAQALEACKAARIRMHWSYRAVLRKLARTLADSPVRAEGE